MELNGIDYQLLASYLAEECNDLERIKVERWIEKSPENKRKFQELRRFWTFSGVAVSSQLPKKGISQEWNRLDRRLSKEKNSSSDSEPANQEYHSYRSSSIHSGTQRFIRVAVVFLIAGFFGLFSYQQWYQPEPKQKEEPVLRQFSTDNGQRASLTLSDGSEVMLNADSKIEVPTEFASDAREIYLDGEAYFKVSKDEDKPFLVHSNKSVVRVLGTSFAVRSYPDDRQVQVVVEEGRVSFGSENKDDEETAILNKNELGTYDITASTVAKQAVEDMDLYLGWREGYLTFEDTKLDQVAKALERRYAVETFFDSDDLKDLSLTAHLKSRSLQNVLSVITESLEIEYQLNDNKVTFIE